MLTKRFFKTKDEAEITFEFSHPEASKVELVAEFNDWQPITMKFIKKDKRFRLKHRLPTEKKFHFRYLIDGKQWDNDHKADGYAANGFGSENSIVDTQRLA
ncbi:isoamylase early set domain-containing protein [Pseudoalteromonas luteoviolacea]|uniref:1,4-alpha-glucan branching protein n=1 Tax=Pseudoalteromonas luteoviolacea NCIMB 1942 TaxID=1365253 RepID=A0A167CTW2_9GAMM|nr:isoamylase early set domain-containing protein [Pseudoalteromonas luteoviolacea]KZN48058.1 1,4-alpha-glucan branching protein [Pseudoalteromonas luteoviolacea NCIMB 1942]KZX01363.1 1,4-alpha-glucan branching protein [Pseudoalteromonas luteoviolacea]